MEAVGQCLFVVLHYFVVIVSLWLRVHLSFSHVALFFVSPGNARGAEKRGLLSDARTTGQRVLGRCGEEGEQGEAAFSRICRRRP